MKIHFLDLIIVLVRYKRILVCAPILCGVIALAVSLTIAPVFTSTTTIIPPQQQNSATAALMAQLGGLASVAGGIANIKSPNDVYVGILGSRTVADMVIDKLALKERFDSVTMDDVRMTLSKMVNISNAKKDGMISIRVSNEDPQFAAELANAYVDALVDVTQSMALTEASQRRLFYERQLKDAKDQLINAEVALRTTQEKTGMIQPEGQVRAIISSVAELRGTIAAKEVQLSAMRTYATAQNPELLRIQGEIRELRAQLAKTETSNSRAEGALMVSAGKIPESGIEYIRSLRAVKYHETMFELLAKQYELAKIDEAKNSQIIQVLDKAVPAQRKSGPKRLSLTMTGIFLGFIFSVFAVFLREMYNASRKDSEALLRWEQLALEWKGINGMEAPKFSRVDEQITLPADSGEKRLS